MADTKSTKVIKNAVVFASVEELVAEGRSVELTVKGFSMRPFLRNNRDVVVLSPLVGRELRKGMVVLFRHNGQHILHRIRRIEGGGLLIKGDGNYRIVEQASVEDVVAYVSAVKLKGDSSFDYGSCRWHLRSAYSLVFKVLRTVAIDVKRRIKR